MQKLIAIGIALTGIASAINLLINRKILKQMATKAQLQEAFTQIRSSVSNVSQDVQNLTDKLANAGVDDELLAEAQAIASSLKAVADLTPDVEPEEPETPEEPGDIENPPQPAPIQE